METNRLKHFCAVVETASLTKSADFLGITHGGLHKSLRVLESELGFPITQPSGRGIEVTREAVAFYPKALEILGLVERSIKGAPSNAKEGLRIGGVEVLIHFLPKAFASENLTDLCVSLFELAPGEIEESLLAGEIDIGFTYLPVPSTSVRYEKIGQIEMGIFCQNKKFLAMPLEEIPFVVPASPAARNPMGIENRDGWKEGEYPRRIHFRANSLSGALQIVEAGLAAIYIPKFIKSHLAENHFEIKKTPVADLRDVYMVLLRAQAETSREKRCAKWIRKLLSSTARK